MNVYLPYTPRLPSEYQEVDYIQSSGTQYINTGFIPSNTTKVEWKMGGWTQSGSHQMFGSRYAWGSSGRGFAIVTDAYQFNGDASVSHGMTNGLDHIGKFSQSGLIVDGVTKATPSTSTFTSPGALFLFGLNNNGTFSESAIMKYYFFKIYNNGTLVRDFVPCYRKSDSVIGLYDLVNSVFYTNAGTGTFSKGNDVTMPELKNAYIGGVWTPGANTIAYYPLEGDANDYSGNGWNGTWTGNESYTTLSSGLKVANFPYRGDGQNYISSSLTTAPATISFWLYFDNVSTSGLQDWRCPIGQYNASGSGWSFAYYTGSNRIYCGSGEYTQTFNAETRYYITITNGKFYLNGNELFTCGSFSSSGNMLSIGTNYKNSEWANYKRALNGKMSRIILESGNRTQEEISDYYNQTKSNYGL